ncbi:hypothetical protein [Sulfitobacter donghicola]|uniref:Uncharacterized protein n=1 Tax=Sulfitobacter donghicola DSW-25 = KCTC 12864 = JCM 14565 TaxID=1300350 RepID=A0A073IV99_9RHOB|nr:hypothetical protein [Sulfitobacter donghicola]KEJ89317.1 hypothetical protein DSW25_09870 [Sulfitobacter donghicola DSW-25 = KCTC 12864 = JCM 14565]KIN69121.1 hypothetical protein Z948_2857 [Sulfitobacter donghicola DSW-25 = KCTC 12864 = JCM 14565]
MLDFIFAVVAMAAAANPPETVTAPNDPPQSAASGSVVIGEGVSIGSATLIEGSPAATAGGLEIDQSVIPKGLAAEAQTPTGKFTTAVEVKPILEATKANWVALRDYGGNDLVYVSHLWAWRCGLSAMAISINDGAMENLPLPKCHTEYRSANVILEEDGLPYLTYPQGSVERVTVQIVYDDLTQDIATFASNEIRIP